MKCLSNCTTKLFTTERMLRAYLPSRIGGLKLTENELKKRLNNPTDGVGPYYFTAEHEDSQEKEKMQQEK